MIGFDTIGNATLIAYDDAPIIATDPWIRGGAYFGSWTFSHEIPREQLDSIARCKYLWFSHGHPDHLSLESIHELSDKEILLADHVGGRIARDLTSLGLKTRVLPERKWVSLSPRVRVMTLSDYNQDSILLLDINGNLLININDANDRGWGLFVKSVARAFKRTYLLKLSHYGDADMINLFDENGGRVTPGAAKKAPVGQPLVRWARVFGANHVVPFSSFHRYQREDSVWANQYVVPLSAYADGFDTNGATLLPAFVRVDCQTAEVTELHPAENVACVKPVSDFGDNWSDRLEQDEKQKLIAYFQKKETLRSHVGFLRFLVGGEETTIDLNSKLRQFGITFEVPRCSLMTAVEYEVFDDLLIGNFMRTTLHGGAKLYPHFTPLVAKYSDNGGANTNRQLRTYFLEYFRRDPVNFLLNMLEVKSDDIFRKMIPKGSKPYKAAQALYWKIK